jgi:hypothetical protein
MVGDASRINGQKGGRPTGSRGTSRAAERNRSAVEALHALVEFFDTALDKIQAAEDRCEIRRHILDEREFDEGFIIYGHDKTHSKVCGATAVKDCKPHPGHGWAVRPGNDMAARARKALETRGPLRPTWGAPQLRTPASIS